MLNGLKKIKNKIIKNIYILAFFAIFGFNKLFILELILFETTFHFS